MFKYLFVILTFLLPFKVFSQRTDTVYKNQVKISPLRLINILNPGVEMSYERLGQHFSSQLSVGSSANIIGKPYKHLKGYTVAVEEKYFTELHPGSRSYVSLDLNFTHKSYTETTSGRDMVNNRTVSDTFTIKKRMHAAAVKYGVQVYRKHFILDMSIGTGLKHRNIVHYDRTLEYKGPREAFDLMRAANMEAKGFVFILPLGVRLGYSF